MLPDERPEEQRRGGAAAWAVGVPATLSPARPHARLAATVVSLAFVDFRPKFIQSTLTRAAYRRARFLPFYPRDTRAGVSGGAASTGLRLAGCRLSLYQGARNCAPPWWRAQRKNGCSARHQ